MHFHRNISFPNCLSHSFSTVSHLCWLIYIVCVGLLYHCWSALKRWTVYNFGQRDSTKLMPAASGFFLTEKTSPLWSVLKAKLQERQCVPSVGEVWFVKCNILSVKPGKEEPKSQHTSKAFLSGLLVWWACSCSLWLLPLLTSIQAHSPSSACTSWITVTLPSRFAVAHIGFTKRWPIESIS